jgi:hypothetical protein
MMVGFVAYVWENPDTAAELAKNPPSPVDLFFDRIDANGDGYITQDEIPAQLKPLIAGSGAKLPDKLSREEFTKLAQGFMSRLKPKRNPDAKKDEQKKP